MKTAIHTVTQGKRYISSTLGETLAARLNASALPPHTTLSSREYEVLLLLAQGRLLKEIGYDLGINIDSVMTHRDRILKKLKLQRTADLIRYVLAHKLLD
jgi:DNA-binding NarL/FixJ family response regulator